MTSKTKGFFSRLFQSAEEYQKYVDESVHAFFDNNTEWVDEMISSRAAVFIERQNQLEIDARLKQEKEIADAEQDRLKTHIHSKDAWFEVIDYRGSLSDVDNYRWNQAFIDRVSIEHGWHGLSAKEVFKRFLADREYQSRLTIIQEERDKHMDDPEPWFEWTVKGISDEGYPVHMEWNPSFISHLREQGFAGRNEDEIVKLWLSRMIRFTPQGEMHE